jgi:hypothetical protein
VLKDAAEAIGGIVGHESPTGSRETLELTTSERRD